ncbi:MAG: hypothetical protein ACKVOE_05210 [Rickettsiales bacterium]
MTERQPIAAPDAEPIARKSKGEKLFDWLVYGGINYLGTFALTVVVADWLQTHAWGRAVCDWGKRGLLKAKFSEGVADAAVTTSILMQGGTLMLLPVHWLEKRRTGIVAWFNEKFGDTTDRTMIAQEVPEQTWGSLVKGRLVAWAVVFSAMFGAEWALKDNFKAFSANTGSWVAKQFGVPAAARNESSLLYRYGKLGALDAFATLASSVILYASSKFFAQRREEQREYREHHPQLAQRAFADQAPMGAAEQLRSDAPSAAIAGARQHEGAVHQTSAALSTAPAV